MNRRVSDPHLFDADPDPVFFLIADPDPGLFNLIVPGNFLKHIFLSSLEDL